MKKKDIANIKSQTVVGLGALLIREVCIKILATGGQFVLVRLLIPEVFGQMAIILLIVGFVDLFSDLGLTQAVIQKEKSLTNKVLSSILIFKLFITFSTITILAFLTPILVSFYELESRITGFIYLLLIASIVRVTKSFLVSLFERNLNYSIIPTIDIIGIIVYYGVSIVLAIRGYGLLSLVIAIVCKEIVEMLVAYIYNPFRPSLYFNVKDIFSFVRFGIPLQLNIFVAFFHRSITTVIASITTSTHALGLLTWSLTIASVPKAVNENFGRVAFSSFSRIQNNKILLNKAVNQSIRILTLIALFFVVHIITSGKEFIELFAGREWIEAYTILVFIVPTALFFSMTATFGQAIIAVGKTKEFLFATSFAVILEWIVTFVFAFAFGYNGIAFSALCGSIILFTLLYILYSSYNYSLPLGDILIRRFIILILCILGGNIIVQSDILTTFIVRVSVVTIIFCLSTFFLAKNDISILLKLRSLLFR